MAKRIGEKDLEILLAGKSFNKPMDVIDYIHSKGYSIRYCDEKIRIIIMSRVKEANKV